MINHSGLTRGVNPQSNAHIQHLLPVANYLCSGQVAFTGGIKSPTTQGTKQTNGKQSSNACCEVHTEEI